MEHGAYMGVQQSWFLLGQIPCEIFKQFKTLVVMDHSMGD